MGGFTFQFKHPSIAKSQINLSSLLGMLYDIERALRQIRIEEIDLSDEASGVPCVDWFLERTENVPTKLIVGAHASPL